MKPPVTLSSALGSIGISPVGGGQPKKHERTKSMKTTSKLTAIVSAFSIMLAGTLSASPPGKGPIGDRSHKPTAQGGTTSSAQHKAQGTQTNRPSRKRNGSFVRPHRQIVRKLSASSATGPAGPNCPAAKVAGHACSEILLAAADSSAI